jgi:serine/threonine protein kinase
VGRCLVLNSKERASSSELRGHGFIADFCKSDVSLSRIKATGTPEFNQADSFSEGITKINLVADMKEATAAASSSSSFVATSVSCLTFDPASTINMNELLARADAAEEAELFKDTRSVQESPQRLSASGIFLCEAEDMSWNAQDAAFMNAYADNDSDDGVNADSVSMENNEVRRPRTCPQPALSDKKNVDIRNMKYGSTTGSDPRNADSKLNLAPRRQDNARSSDDDEEGSTDYLDFFEAKK